MRKRSMLPAIVLMAVTSGAAIALCFAILLRFQFDPLNFFAMLVVPLGALLFGIIAPLGAVAGAKIANLGPGPRLCAVMVGGALTAFTVYLVLLATLLDLADPDHPGVFASLIGREMETAVTFQRASRQVEILDALGGWGLALLGLKFAGVGVGALAVHASMKLLPYCAKCRVFTRTIDKGQLYFPSLEQWLEAINVLPEGEAPRADAMLSLPRRAPFSLSRGNGHVQVRMRRHACPKCHEQHMRERVFVQNGKVPLEQPGLSLAYSWMPPQSQAMVVRTVGDVGQKGGVAGAPAPPT